MGLITATGKLLALTADDEDLRSLARQFKVSYDELKAEHSLISSIKPDCNTLFGWLGWLKDGSRDSQYRCFCTVLRNFCVCGVTS